MKLQRVNPHGEWIEDEGRWRGCQIAATGQNVAPGEVFDVDDPDLAVGLLAQPDNFVPADAETHQFLTEFCELVKAVQAKDAAAKVATLTPPVIERAFTPPEPPVNETAKERKARERAEQEAASAATSADASADKGGE